MRRLSRDRLALFVIAGLFVALPSDAGHAQSRPTLEDTAACADRAARETLLVPAQRARLCVATPSPSAPIDCFLDATRTLLLTDPQGIELCRCTPTLAPVACFRMLRDAGLLTEPEMVAACSPTITERLRADCTPVP